MLKKCNLLELYVFIKKTKKRLSIEKNKTNLGRELQAGLDGERRRGEGGCGLRGDDLVIHQSAHLRLAGGAKVHFGVWYVIVHLDVVSVQGATRGTGAQGLVVIGGGLEVYRYTGNG